MAPYIEESNNGNSSHNGRNGNGASASHKGLLASQQESIVPPAVNRLKTTGTKATRQSVVDTFDRFGQFIHASNTPPPNQVSKGTFTTKKKPGIGQDIKALRWKDVKTLKEVVLQKIKGQKITDDKTMIMERVIQLVSNLPSDSKVRVELTDTFLNELWYSLDHPAPLFVADKFKYRMADGSYNNIHMPQYGAAGSYYARSVRPTIIPRGALPDPNLIFESVMKRTNYRKHPNNVSSVLWYWATIIIHDLFWTDHTSPDMSKSKTSSYLDLSPLYGSNQEMQDSVRTFKQGKLKADSFADKRLHGMPPGVGVLLVMFNRFHNHVCDNLMAINEGGRFTPPSPTLPADKAEAAWKQYDYELFQTARLVTSGLYINITLLDYVRNIVNLNRVDTTWTLDPRQDMGIDVGTMAGAERGVGNAVSAEFNLCYRWHSCISAKDDKWIQDFYYELFNKAASQVTPRDLMGGFVKFERSIPNDPLDRTFGKFERGPDGKYDDDDLAECMAQAVEDCAGAFGGQNVPESMRAVEILGIIQGRKWNLAGLNEFRKHFGLKPYETFEDINSDPGVADQLRHLYEHPDHVELYPGLVAEEAKKPMAPGVGIAPTYTISRVVLSDAVCLVRGDRYYTTDYNPRHLTSWGFDEVQYDLNINNGCVFYKLFIRALPHHFRYNSVYAHYPMVIPSENRKILADMGKSDEFDFARPARVPETIVVSSYGASKHVLQSQDIYSPVVQETFSTLLTQGPRQLAIFEKQGLYSMLDQPSWHSHIKSFYRFMTEKLLMEKSYMLGGQRQVDIVRDVGNLTQVHFASRLFDLPLQTRDSPKGICDEHELYMMLALLSICLFSPLDPVQAFPMRKAAEKVAQLLGQATATKIKAAHRSGLLGVFGGGGGRDDPLGARGHEMVRELLQSGLTAPDLAWNSILPTAAALVPNQAELFARAVDFYLSPEGADARPDLFLAATSPPSETTDSLLLGYVMEGVRLSGPKMAYREAVATDHVQDNEGQKFTVRPRDRILVSSASSDTYERYFPEPQTVNPRRPLEAYISYGAGPHALLGRRVSHAALVEMFRALFKRKNVRRAPGPQGELKKVTQPDGSVVYLREDWGAEWPFPVSMKIMWDE